MIVNCIHFRESSRDCGGTCLAGLHQGKPSYGTCKVCPHKNAALQDIPRTIKLRLRDKNCPTCKPIIVSYQQPH